MPLYSVEHITPLNPDQKDEIAAKITEFHSEEFTTPRLFVNVQFQDISTWPTYVAGKRRRTNRIVANVRSGGNRKQDQWNNVCKNINEMWAKTVGEEGDKDLRAIFILGGMIAGSEAGFDIPGPGEDAEWLKTNIKAFKEKADGGDQDFRDMLTEMHQRDAFKEIAASVENPPKSEEEKKKEKEEKEKKKQEEEGKKDVDKENKTNGDTSNGQ